MNMSSGHTADDSPQPEEPRPESAHWLRRLPRRAVIFPVRIYQLTLSPLLGASCRFHPSCSNYFIQAVEKYGAVKGSCKGVARICRCHPWHPGGYDPP